MVIFSIDLVLLIPALMISATPVLLAAVGEAVVEKSGVLNLGVEGMMITGAVIGFIIAVKVHDYERVLYANSKAGSIKKYFITALGNKTINRYLLSEARRSRPRLYEKLFGTANSSIRESEGQFA